MKYLRGCIPLDIRAKFYEKNELYNVADPSFRISIINPSQNQNSPGFLSSDTLDNFPEVPEHYNMAKLAFRASVIPECVIPWKGSLISILT